MNDTTSYAWALDAFRTVAREHMAVVARYRAREVDAAALFASRARYEAAEEACDAAEAREIARTA